jgi:hypothetical protein
LIENRKSERALAHQNSHRIFDLDVRDPNFAHEMRLWTFQVQQEIQELVAATQEAIDTSKALIAETDQLVKPRVSDLNLLPHRA